MSPVNKTRKQRKSRKSSKVKAHTNQERQGLSRTVQGEKSRKTHISRSNKAEGNGWMNNAPINNEKRSNSGQINNFRLSAKRISLTLVTNSPQCESSNFGPSYDPRNEGGLDSATTRIREGLFLYNRNRLRALSELERCERCPLIYRQEIGQIMQCLRRQEIGPLPLNDLDWHSPKTRHGYNTEARKKIVELLELLDYIQHRSLEVKEQAVKIHQQIISNAPRLRKERAVLLLSELNSCSMKTRSTTKDILHFQYLFHMICALNPHDQPPSTHGGQAGTVDALLYLDKSRYASESLYLMLGHICEEHETHDLYFSLDTMRKGQEARYAFEFRFAFQRTDRPQDGLVWMRSCPSTSDEEPHENHTRGQECTECGNGRVNATANHVPTRPFCPGILTQNVEFKMEIGEGLVLESTQNENSGPRQVQLSCFLKSYREYTLRLRLARLISEAVMSLDPKLWNQKSFESHNVMVVAPSTYDIDSLESHIQVRLDRQKDRHGNNHQPCQAQTHAVLFSLGLTLLELALSPLVERPDSEGFMENRTDLMVAAERVKDEMGEHYARAVHFCLFDYPPIENFYDGKVQTAFYELVVRGLELQEIEDDEAKAPAEDEIRKIVNHSLRQGS
ncbi:hypothetical protein F4677DRAFT_418602 [Hypoxylon crocopeplum]|nr:hypothetical protein F4677DRAFT_418602 [Hypoxylon crocopeplum]